MSVKALDCVSAKSQKKEKIETVDSHQLNMSRHNVFYFLFGKPTYHLTTFIISFSQIRTLLPYLQPRDHLWGIKKLVWRYKIMAREQLWATYSNKTVTWLAENRWIVTNCWPFRRIPFLATLPGRYRQGYQLLTWVVNEAPTTKIGNQ